MAISDGKWHPSAPQSYGNKENSMPTPLIKYTPDIEIADPRFDETLQAVIAKTEQYITGVRHKRRHGPRRPRRACQRVRTGQGGGRHTRSTSYGIRARHLRQTRKTRCTHPLLERLTARWGRRATWWCDRIGVENVRHRWFDAPRGRARYPPPSTTPTSMHRSFSITRSNTTSSFRNCL